MKKFFPILLLITTLVGCSLNENPIFEDYSSRQLKTEIKYKVDLKNSNVKTIVYQKNYTSDGKLSKYYEFYENGKIKSVSEFIYENNKAFENQNNYDENGELKNSTKIISLLDEKGKIREKHYLTLDGKIISKEFYSYDTQGNLLRKVCKNFQIGSEQLIEYSYKYDNGSLIERTVSEKAPSGNIISRDSINYKQSEKLIEIINYNQNGEIQIIKTFYYNRYGLISTEIESDRLGNIIKKYIYNYEYY